MDHTTLLRAGLLAGRRVALSGPPADEVHQALTNLGARIESPQAGVHALVHDAAPSFGHDGLVQSLRDTWMSVVAVANTSLIPKEQGGKIVMIAPCPHIAPHAEAARTGLENLARTLSTEWARYAITTTAIAPGEETTIDQIAALVCFLISPAGDYFSGCRFDLGAARAR